MALPSLSVIVPSLNQGRYISSTLNSIIQQDYPNLEILVLDGGSTDNTLDILKSQPPGVRWVSQPDAGQADAINRGFEQSTGEILAWLNSDDLYCPEALRRVGEFFRDHPETDWVYGKAVHINEKGDVIAPYPTELFTCQRLAEVCFLCQPAVFFRRSLWKKGGGLDLKLHFALDYDYWIRLSRLSTPQYLPQTLAASRLHEDTKTLSNRRRCLEEIVRTARVHFNQVALSWVLGWACFEWAEVWGHVWPKQEYSSRWFLEGLRAGRMNPRTWAFALTLLPWVGVRYVLVNRGRIVWRDWSHLAKKIQCLFQGAHGIC